MHDRTARVFSGLGVLVLLWIVVYWAWPPRDDGALPGRLTFAQDTEGLGDTESDGIRDSSVDGGERFPDPDVGTDGVRTGVEPGDPASGRFSSDGVPRSGGGVIAPVFDDYVVRAGDHFERISMRVYGTRRHAMAIGRANPLLDPRKLRAGMTIRVPRDPENIQGVPVDESGEPETRPVPQNAPETIEYTVKRGDTLSGIAKAFYGSTRHVDFLYEANRDRLASRDDLRLGQVLRVPPMPGEAD